MPSISSVDEFTAINDAERALLVAFRRAPPHLAPVLLQGIVVSSGMQHFEQEQLRRRFPEAEF